MSKLFAAAGLGGLFVLVLSAQNQKLVNVIPNSTGNAAMFTWGGQPLNLANAADAAQLGNIPSYKAFRNLSVLSNALDLGIATALSSIPIASPASSVILKENPATGLGVPAAATLGPILTERAETIGKKKFFLGISRQEFNFDTLEGEKLRNFRTLYAGGDPSAISQGGPARTTAPMTFSTQVGLHLDQTIAFFTYGLTDKVDVSAALPLIHAAIGATSFNAQIRNSGNPAEANCWCVQTFNPALSNQTFNTDFGSSGFVLRGPFAPGQAQSATGIGDVLFRVKGTVLGGQHAALALGGDLRTPSGDARNFLGSGAIGFKPFAAISLYTGQIAHSFAISPHFNIGYQVNGNSVLAGDPLTGKKARLPDEFVWAAGTEVGLTRNATVVVDFLGQRVINAFRPVPMTANPLGSGALGQAGGPAYGFTVSSAKQSYSINDGAFGLKVKAVGNFVISFNTLVALDQAGLRSKVVPLLGVSYTFQ